MKKGAITKTRVERAIDLLAFEMESSTNDYALIADIVLLLASKEHMSTQRAKDILQDTEKILPYITELRLL